MGCSVVGCDRPHSGKGLCRMHYLRAYRGQPLGGPEVRQAGSLAEALASRIVVDANGCHIWQGYITAAGYGVISAFGYSSSHRAAYELAHGPIPDGLELDHLCRVRACANPDHLEPVTRSVNIRRGLIAERNWNRAKDRCKYGHPFDEENTYRWTNGHRSCRTCHRERERARVAA